MTGILKIGQTIQTSGGQSCHVLAFLGGGGQGEVYRVRWCDQEHALKWYYKPSATESQREVLRELIRNGSPSSAFLWPLELVSDAASPGFGYLMPLRENRYKSITDLMAGRIQPSFLALIDAAINLTKAFRTLHTSGLCYRDISFGNAFFDPATGQVLVCDNDNVGATNVAYAGVLGTPDFMAPEIVRGKSMPSTKTDLHSLAVLLFYLLHVGHPLVGRRVLSIRCWDSAARTRIFGEHPRFIFDSGRNDNEAVSLKEDTTGETGGQALVYWNLYPSRIKDTFTKAFTQGLADPDARVTELEWLNALADLRNRILKCACGTPNFLDDVGGDAVSAGTCWSCKKTLPVPYRMKVGRQTVVMNADTRLYPHHLEHSAAKLCDFSTPLAEMAQNPKDPSRWGLRNLGKKKWVAILSDGGMLDVDPGKAVPLLRGMGLNFGKIEAEVL